MKSNIASAPVISFIELPQIVAKSRGRHPIKESLAPVGVTATVLCSSVVMYDSRSRIARQKAMTNAGVAGLFSYAIHAGFHIVSGRPEEALWMCHLGAALVGIGLLISSSAVNGIGTL